MAVDRSDQFVIATNLQSNTGTVFAINPDNTLTQTGTFTTGIGPFSVQFGPTAGGPFFYVPNAGSGNVSGFAFDSLTGNATPLPGFPVPAGIGPIKIKIVDALNPID